MNPVDFIRIPESAEILFLAGPTAVGKSELALSLADRLNGEIVSVDSMQVYRGLDIGTAKPSAQEQARVPHHLIDVVGVTESFDAAQFVALAQQAVAQIRGRGRLPIFCGGTGLYFKAFLEGLGESPDSDPILRAQIVATPLESLLAELAAADPVTYERIDRQNPRRVIRAVEVIRLTGKPFSAQRANWTGPKVGMTESPLFCLSRPLEALRERIDRRVEAMFDQGLVQEVRGLLGQGLDRNPKAMQALGYRQVVEHLRGELTLPKTVELVKIRTRQFAKKQMTWFRRQFQAQWIDLESVSTS